jgi:hypothetical protein
MTLEIIRAALGWCFIINLGILLLWAIILRLAGDWAYRMHSAWVKISRETFDGIHYGGMAAFKLGMILFNLAPYLALRIVG